jgi:hypothetical protein
MGLTVEPYLGKNLGEEAQRVADEEDGENPGEQGSLIVIVLTVEPLPAGEYRRRGPACDR